MILSFDLEPPYAREEGGVRRQGRVACVREKCEKDCEEEEQ